MSRINSPEWLRDLADKVLAGEIAGNVEDAILLEQLAVDAEFVKQAQEHVARTLQGFPGVGDRGSETTSANDSKIGESSV